MIKILCFMVFFSFILPLKVIADDLSFRTNDYFQKTQSMIDSHVFLQEGGAEKMQEYSTNLNEGSRKLLYDDNAKHRALGWLNLALPSLGNWLVGDYNGGTITVIGYAGGETLYLGGYILFISAFEQQNIDTFFYTGISLMAAGIIISIASEIYGTVSALSYADYFNDNLKAGLGISYNDSFKPVDITASVDMNNRELFFVNLVSYSF